MVTFGKRFKELRLEKQLTQEKLASMFHINKSSVSRYEKNNQMPEIDMLQSFADFFDVSVDYLLGRNDIKNNNTTNQIKKYNLTSSAKDEKNEKDVEKLLNKTIKTLQDGNGFMLNGEILDKEDIILLTEAIRNGLQYAKISSKKKNVN